MPITTASVISLILWVVPTAQRVTIIVSPSQMTPPAFSQDVPTLQLVTSMRVLAATMALVFTPVSFTTAKASASMTMMAMEYAMNSKSWDVQIHSVVISMHLQQMREFVNTLRHLETVQVTV
jgi:hypothetical protein